MRNINQIDPHVSKINWPYLENSLLFENPSFSDKTSMLILDTNYH